MKKMMKKMHDKKGFTLAELLVVVAIIAILVAVSIPIFTAQLAKSRKATNLANIRSAKAAAVSAMLADNLDSIGITFTADTGSYVVGSVTGDTSTTTNNWEDGVKDDKVYPKVVYSVANSGAEQKYTLAE
ncbi:MAG: prepilin-type N-terminal cleavage/methylation domain-containing protein [Lachnospiraceae bacterium]|nr:prepilin-type N-terminal cleavage/methylation domain-containing protein [Lachnospiraceae bacterium]